MSAAKDTKGVPQADEIVAVAWNTHHGPGLFNQLQIEPDGSTWLVVRFASPVMDAKMLGGYQALLSPTEPIVRDVFDSIRSERILELEETVPSGSRVAAQTIIVAGSEEVKSFESGPDNTFVGALAQLGLRLQAVARAALSSPVMTLAFEWELDRKEYRPGESCRIHLRFKNEGSSPVLFGNPRWRSEDVLSELSLQWWAKGAGTDGTDELVMIWNLGEAEWLIEPRKAISSDDEILQVPPKSTLDIDLQWLIPRMKWHSYFVGATLRSSNPDESDRPGFVEGLLFAQSQDVEILPPAK